MNSDQQLYELFDKRVKGQLSAEELVGFEARMKTDPLFRQKAEEHSALIKDLQFFGERKEIKSILDEVHASLSNASVPKTKTIIWKSWHIAAIAASIALICVVGTVLVTQSVQSKQTAYYQELRRHVDQIRKSQKLMMESLGEAKPKPQPGNYAGTGFLVSAKGYVATSYHVVKGADSVVLENEKFGRLKATLVHSDPINDISVLKIEGELNLRSLPFTIADDEASLAENVFTLGFPREDIVFGEGSISARSGYNQNPNAYQVSIPVNPGNSGSPVLNSKGDLIGMISGYQAQMAGAAFAIKSSVLLNTLVAPALDTLSVPFILPKQNTLKNANRVQQVKQWTDYVFMIRVFKD
jgi:serine protease Do